MTAICSLGGTFSAGSEKMGNVVILSCGSIICMFIVRLISRFRRCHTVTVVVTVEDKTTKFTALCDSGNLVTEPLSGKPVIIADISVINKLIPSPDLSGNMITDPLRTRLRIIPSRSIDGGRTLTGFIPDNVSLILNRKTVVCDAVIATSDFGSTFFGGYPANAPASLLF